MKIALRSSSASPTTLSGVTELRSTPAPSRTVTYPHRATAAGEVRADLTGSPDTDVVVADHHRARARRARSRCRRSPGSSPTATAGREIRLLTAVAQTA